MITNNLSVFIDELIPYDYILFGSVFAIFILLIILVIVLRKKTFIAITLFLLAFLIVILGPTLGYSKMHSYIFKNSTKITEHKKLTYTKAIVVQGTLKNESNVDFSLCKIKASAYKVNSNAIKNYLFQFNPFKEMSILEYDIKKDETIEFKIIIDSFNYSKDYNVSVGASCR